MAQLVPDELWEIVEPLLPAPKARRFRYPGRKPVDNRVALSAILFVLKTGIAWEDVPHEMGCCGMTAWKKLDEWQTAGVWDKIHLAVLERLQAQGKLDWEWALVDSSRVRATGGGDNTGPNPIDRAKAGTKHHAISDGNALPLATKVTGANRNDTTHLRPLVCALWSAPFGLRPLVCALWSAPFGLRPLVCALWSAPFGLRPLVCALWSAPFGLRPLVCALWSAPFGLRPLVCALWATSRVMDYLQSDAQIDANKVAIVGHSRGGKAALWARAQDERFALVISNDSGSTGAALARGKQGESRAKINGLFPHWFCENYKKYNDHENELPVDPHQLLTLIAPRLLYVASASKDDWANPAAEWQVGVVASPVYKLFGPRGLPNTQTPAPKLLFWMGTSAIMCASVHTISRPSIGRDLWTSPTSNTPKKGIHRLSK